jgi:hypothetical protein
MKRMEERRSMFHAMNAQFDSTMVGQGGGGHNEESSSRKKSAN